MKTKLYTTIIIGFLILNACKSIEKLVDEGRYDEAIVLATKKLAGKKKKKTKHIRALEEAFAKVNANDMSHIEYLKSRNDLANWERIYDYALDINSRQNRVTPFLPLISKEGYVGHFQLIDTRPILKEAAEHAAAFRYNVGLELLENARATGNKIAAQEAHHSFLAIDEYFNNYKNTDSLTFESYSLGTFHILLKWDESFPEEFTRAIPADFRQLDTKWKMYHIDYVDDIAFDVVTTLFIDDIDLSPEQERVNTFVESKENEKWVDAIDRDGNVVKDTSGQVIQVKETKTIHAFITEIFRTKEAHMHGRAQTVDFSSGEVIGRDEFKHEVIFASDACTIEGNRNALSTDVRKRVGQTLLPFPADYEMINEGIDQMQDKFLRHAKKLDLYRHFDTPLATTY